MISSSVAQLEGGLFRGCTALTSIIIPSSATKIKECAFLECKSLSSIVIPNSVTTIQNNVFLYCSSLTKVYYTGNESEWNSISGNDQLSSQIKYFYSETEPTDIGNFWHYVEGVVVEW